MREQCIRKVNPRLPVRRRWREGKAVAQKRMFSLQVVDTDRFTDMPPSAQSLYFHLGMHGDDDGFVSSPKKIQRSVGCNDDDMRLLAEKGFIIPFDSGVVAITDWKINNLLKRDRYTETIYQDEKASLCLKNNGKYALGTEVEPERNQTGTMMEPQYSIEEDSIDKNNQSKQSEKPAGKLRDVDFEKFWSVYPKKVGKSSAKKAFSRVKEPVETLLTAIERQKCSVQWSKENGQYIPNPATWLNQGRWEDELTAASSQNPYPEDVELVDDGNGGLIWRMKG